MFLLSILLGLFQLVPAHAQAAPVELAGYSVGGSGCPAGSVSVTLAPGGGAISILYSKLYGEAAAGDRNIRVNCNLNIKLKKPKDMAFTFTSADFRGFVDLEAGAYAQQKVRLTAGGGGPRDIHLSEQTWTGPLSQDYIMSVVPHDPDPSADCRGKSPNAHISLKVALVIRSNKAAQSSGMIVVDSFDAGMAQKYSMRWTKCNRVRN